VVRLQPLTSLATSNVILPPAVDQGYLLLYPEKGFPFNAASAVTSRVARQAPL